MKNSIILLIIFYLALSNIFAQETNNSKISVITDLDKNIFEAKHIDVKTLSKNIINTISRSPETSDNNLDTLVLRLYAILELENPAIKTDTLLFLLENVRTYETVYELYSKLNKEVLAIEEDMSGRDRHIKDTYLGGLKRNLKVVEEHMKHILEYTANIKTLIQLIS